MEKQAQTRRKCMCYKEGIPKKEVTRKYFYSIVMPETLRYNIIISIKLYYHPTNPSGEVRAGVMALWAFLSSVHMAKTTHKMPD